MIDELNNEVIPEGEEIMNDLMVETVEPTDDLVHLFT